MKRFLEGSDGDSAAKIARIDEGNLIRRIQRKLTSLDRKCRKEQVVIQLRYDALKKIHFERRAQLFRRIPLFWKDVLAATAGRNGFLFNEELPVLDYLEDIKLDDNQDINGSHKFTFTFSADNPYFKKRTLIKDVRVSTADGASVEIRCTPIVWLQEVVKTIKLGPGQTIYHSLFHWLQSKEEQPEGDFGSYFRANVWENALRVYSEMGNMRHELDEYYKGLIDSGKPIQ